LTVKNCQKLDIFSNGNFFEKMKIFDNFFGKNVKFWAIFDIQMAIFRRVRTPRKYVIVVLSKNVFDTNIFDLMNCAPMWMNHIKNNRRQNS